MNLLAFAVHCALVHYPHHLLHYYNCYYNNTRYCFDIHDIRTMTANETSVDGIHEIRKSFILLFLCIQHVKPSSAVCRA